MRFDGLDANRQSLETLQELRARPCRRVDTRPVGQYLSRSSAEQMLDAVALFHQFLQGGVHFAATEGVDLQALHHLVLAACALSSGISSSCRITGWPRPSISPLAVLNRMLYPICPAAPVTATRTAGLNMRDSVGLISRKTVETLRCPERGRSVYTRDHTGAWCSAHTAKHIDIGQTEVIFVRYNIKIATRIGSSEPWGATELPFRTIDVMDELLCDCWRGEQERRR